MILGLLFAGINGAALMGDTVYTLGRSATGHSAKACQRRISIRKAPGSFFRKAIAWLIAKRRIGNRRNSIAPGTCTIAGRVDRRRQRAAPPVVPERKIAGRNERRLGCLPVPARSDIGGAWRRFLPVGQNCREHQDELGRHGLTLCDLPPLHLIRLYESAGQFAFGRNIE
jgi:hypothetical protein